MVSKKLLFSAVAVLAFNGVAMANSAEVKDEVVISIQSKLIILAESCETKAMDYIDRDYDSDGVHSAMENHDAYQAYLAGCKD